MAQATIENIVASTSIASGVDLKDLAQRLKVEDFDPETFPGILYKIDEPPVAFLILRSGKVVTTGAKSLRDLRTAMASLVQRLTEAGVKLDGNIEIRIKDVVLSADLGSELDLNALALSFGVDRIEYVPDEFPGLIYRTDDKKLTFLIFRSGKVVCTGATKTDEARRALDRLEEEIRHAGLLA
ncbi:MAG TPA: TATA-box-binding protein [Thermoplasmata archaeon]|nr:TATA-box-binding protein [Thermoplasmata archaeon]